MCAPVNGPAATINHHDAEVDYAELVGQATGQLDDAAHRAAASRAQAWHTLA